MKILESKIFGQILAVVVVTAIIALSCFKFGKLASSGDTIIDSESPLNFEKAISQDRQRMNMKYGEGKYRWYKCVVVTRDYFDAEGAEDDIEGITNVFQVQDNEQFSSDIYIICMERDGNGAYEPRGFRGFWVSDFPMNAEPLNLNFRQAWRNMMASDYEKPRSKFCILRKQVGPTECNPQFIFGNSTGQIYVDAVTGAVTDINPAFKGHTEAIDERIDSDWPEVKTE